MLMVMVVLDMIGITLFLILQKIHKQIYTQLISLVLVNLRVKNSHQGLKILGIKDSQYNLCYNYSKLLKFLRKIKYF